MIKIMLGGLQNRHDFEIFHVDARVSDDLGDIGGIRLAKIFRLFGFCLHAIIIRLTHGPMDLYYVPAPTKRSAIVRDWIVMILVRPWFRRTIFHWHALGLGHWAVGQPEKFSGEVETQPPSPVIFGKQSLEKVAQWLTRKTHALVELSIVLTSENQADAVFLCPKRVAIVPNGIPDPCPDFEQNILPLRIARECDFRSAIDPWRAAISKIGNCPESSSMLRGKPVIFSCLYLAHCTEEKGLFETIECILHTNRSLADKKVPLLLTLTIAGSFMDKPTEAKFRKYLVTVNRHFTEGALASGDFNQIGKNFSPVLEIVSYRGYIESEEKRQAMIDHDCLISLSHRETYGLSVAEALAYGMRVCLSPIAAYRENFGDIGAVANDVGVRSASLALETAILTDCTPLSFRNFFKDRCSDREFVSQLARMILEKSDIAPRS